MSYPPVKRGIQTGTTTFAKPNEAKQPGEAPKTEAFNKIEPPALKPEINKKTGKVAAVTKAPPATITVRTVGLTGGMGSGKSSVARIFKKLGAPYVDADVLAKKLRSPGGLAEPFIKKRFGTTDPAKLRQLISTNPEAKKDLEGILHPLIQQISQKELTHLAANSKAPFIVYEASLLVEAGRADDFTDLIIVTAPEAERVKRVVKRDKCSPEQALAMIKSQLSDPERQARVKKSKITLIENTGNLAELEEKVRKTLDQLK